MEISETRYSLNLFLYPKSNLNQPHLERSIGDFVCVKKSSSTKPVSAIG